MIEAEKNDIYLTHAEMKDIIKLIAGTNEGVLQLIDDLQARVNRLEAEAKTTEK